MTTKINTTFTTLAFENKIKFDPNKKPKFSYTPIIFDDKYKFIQLTTKSFKYSKFDDALFINIERDEYYNKLENLLIKKISTMKYFSEYLHKNYEFIRLKYNDNVKLFDENKIL